MADREKARADLSTDREWQLQVERVRFDAHVTVYAGKLASKDTDIAAIYRRLVEAENRLVPNGDYVNGSARVDDQLLILHGINRVLLTAEHATVQIRKSLQKEADMGTAALAEVVAQDTNRTAIIAIGKQTGDGNYDVDHPMHHVMSDIIHDPENRAHLSLHMLDRGRASQPDDQRGYSILLGVGKDPSEATLALKDYLLGAADDLDLRAGVNVPHINFDESHQLRRNEDGSVRTVTFAGAGAGTTRTYSQSLAEESGKRDAYAAIQVEINEVLLVRQNDEVGYPSELDQQLGAYLGYLFVRNSVESVSKL